MSTSNKITQSNCWSLQLTENLTQVLGTSSGANAFQTAASAIDASVKIFAMRVDSVHQETFKLQSGLNRTDVGDEAGGVAGEAAGAADGVPKEEARPQPAHKRKQTRMASTLVKNESDLDERGFEMQYEEDPLVKKASSAFDTGGARGLLLNQLSIYQGVTLVFDSGDAPQDVGRKGPPEDTAAMTEVGSDLRDQFALLMSRIGTAEICPEIKSYKSGASPALRDDFLQAQLEKMQPANVFPVHQFTQPAPVQQQQQQQQMSSQQPQSQSQSSERVLARSSQPSQQVDYDAMQEVAPMDIDEPHQHSSQPQQSQSQANVYADDQFGGGGDNFDYGGGGGDEDDLDDAPRDFDADGNIISSPAHVAARAGVLGGASTGAAATMRGSVQVVPGNAPVGNGEMIVENNGQISDDMVRALVSGLDETGYYKAKPTNWTGPEHWNFKGPKAIKAAKAAAAEGGNEENDEAKSKPVRKKRGAADAQFFIDFTRPADTNWEEAFAPPKRGNTKLTKSTKEKAKILSTVLPADVHYGPNVLMSLFTKPKWMIPKQILSWKPIVDPAAQGQVPIALDEGEQQQMQAEQEQGGAATAWFTNASAPQQQNGDGEDDFDNGGDYGGFDGEHLGYGDAGEPQSASQQHEEQMQQQQAAAIASARKSRAFDGRMLFEVTGVQREFLVAEPQRAEQIQLSFAKVARAVDVKVLKASIWKALKPAPAVAAAAAAGAEPETQSFQELLDDLPARIPRFEQSNVTIPFCFISLLHLANEQGLELRSDGLDSLQIVQH